MVSSNIAYISIVVLLKETIHIDYVVYITLDSNGTTEAHQ